MQREGGVSEDPESATRLPGELFMAAKSTREWGDRWLAVAKKKVQEAPSALEGAGGRKEATGDRRIERRIVALRSAVFRLYLGS